MKKKLSKTEKIKRLRKIKSWLKERKKSDYSFMCNFYDNNYFGSLFKDIPELYKYRPKEIMILKGLTTEAWTFSHLKDYKTDSEHKITRIDKAIKLIQSK